MKATKIAKILFGVRTDHPHEIFVPSVDFVLEAFQTSTILGF
jgi:hypothetical protein